MMNYHAQKYINHAARLTKRRQIFAISLSATDDRSTIRNIEYTYEREYLKKKFKHMEMTCISTYNRIKLLKEIWMPILNQMSVITITFNIANIQQKQTSPRFCDAFVFWSFIVCSTCVYQQCDVCIHFQHVILNACKL